MVQQYNNIKPDIPVMLAELDSIYEKEVQILEQIERLNLLLQQLQDDKELLQNLIMYQSNKNYRGDYR